MSHVYLFSHVGLYVFPYLLNYITSLYWKLSENYKHGCRNDQPIRKNKGRNKSNELSSNNLRFFQNNLGLVFHTTYSCIFHFCYLAFSTPAFSTPAICSCFFHSCIFHPCHLLLLFPLSHFPPLQFWPYHIFHSRIFSRPAASYSGDKMAMRPFVKILWLLVIIINFLCAVIKSKFISNKAIVDIRLRLRCAIPPLPSRTIGRIACAQNISEDYVRLLSCILNDPFCCMTLLAIELSILQRTTQRRCSDRCSEYC